MAEAVLNGRGIKESADAESTREGENGDGDDARRAASRTPRRPREAAPASA